MQVFVGTDGDSGLNGHGPTWKDGFAIIEYVIHFRYKVNDSVNNYQVKPKPKLCLL